MGALTAEQARQAIDQNQSISEVMTTDIPTVSEDTLLADLMDVMATSSLPISVIDEQNRIKGIVIRGAVIGALAGNKDSLNEMESDDDMNIPKIPLGEWVDSSRRMGNRCICWIIYIY